MEAIKGCRFNKHGVKDPAGKYHPCWYSHQTLLNGREAITLYARSVLKGLPRELAPENNSDMMTDYFEKDKVRFYAGTSEFEMLKGFANGN